jgi:hypothetical protein
VLEGFIEPVVVGDFRAKRVRDAEGEETSKGFHDECVKDWQSHRIAKSVGFWAS